MDNHPIPQDVTNFQFHLIGDMTLKQFGYVTAGVIIAWVMLSLPFVFIVKFIFAGFSVLIGVGLAFIPIDGRPADEMFVHFIKALLNPTQFVYKKSDIATTAVSAMTTTPTTLPTTQHAEDKKTQDVHFDSTKSIAHSAAQSHLEQQTKEARSIAQPPTTNIALSNMTTSTHQASLQQEEKNLEAALIKAKDKEKSEKDNPQLAATAHQKVVDLENELQETLLQKQELEKQLLTLQKSLDEKKKQVFTPSVATPTTQSTQHVKQIPQQMKAGVGVPLVPDVPNLVIGVIKDPRGNILQNILIEVKDKDNNPVRAFKTNVLGQFASATPLLNGTYTISFEDPTGKQSFDSVEITANGQILPPLEIISIDARERLRQELFGNT